jgi:ABC-type nitrate/sulfonate/bicarbonate transport system substrate-binding protein
MHHRSIVKLTTAAVAAGLIVLTSGCATDTGSPAASDDGSYGSVDVALSWIKNNEFAGEYVASENGYYTDEGLDSVTLLAGGGSTSAESLLLSGGADIGLSSAPVTAAAIDSSEAGMKIIGATYQKNPFGIASLDDNVTFTTPQDLVGKTIGVQAGGNQILFEAFLEANDIDPASVDIVGVEYDWAPLLEGTVDGFLAYITDDVKLDALGHDASVMSFADNGLPFVAETFTVLDDTIAGNRDMLKAFLRAEIRGWTDAINDPETAIDLTVDKYGADQKLNYAEEWAQGVASMERLIVSDNTTANGLFTMSDEMIDENIASLTALGYDLSADDLFDMSLLEEIYAEDPSLISTLTPVTDYTSPR